MSSVGVQITARGKAGVGLELPIQPTTGTRAMSHAWPSTLSGASSTQPCSEPGATACRNRMQTRMSCLAGIRHGVWDFVSRGISGHRLYIGDVTFADLCISIISSQPLWCRSSACYRRDEQPARGRHDTPRGRWAMPTAVIDSLNKTDASAPDGAEVASASCSAWLSARRQTLWEACRRRWRRTGLSSDSMPSRTASVHGMLVASDVSRHASSVPS